MILNNARLLFNRRAFLLFNFLCLREHVFDEDAVAAGGIAHKNVGHGAHRLAVPENGRPAHECVKDRSNKNPCISQEIHGFFLLAYFNKVTRRLLSAPEESLNAAVFSALSFSCRA